MDDRRLEQLVTPFYLDMMRLNALECDAPFLSRVARAGQSASTSEVVELLRDSWRPRVMGAWFSVLHDPTTVRDELLTSLESSAGSLTSPPLATAAVIVAGADALPALATYVANDLAWTWGAAGFAAAAADHVGGRVTGAEATDRDRADLAALVRVAEALQAVGEHRAAP